MQRLTRSLSHVRTYVVQVGDSPAQIAAKFAGCPKCAIDLIQSNTHKQSVRHPNGFLSFRELRAGETLWLPDKWFSAEFDALPSSYFESLPYPDGVTPPKRRVGVLGDYATLENATRTVNSLASKSDDDFVVASGRAADLIDASIQEVRSSTDPEMSPYATGVKAATDWARTESLNLLSALQNGDVAAATSARLQASNALSTALGAARISLEAYYDEGVEIGPAVIDPEYEIDIGPATIEPSPSPVPAPPPPAPAPSPVVAAPSEDRGLSTGAMVGLSLLGAGAIGGAVHYWINRRPRVRRIRPSGKKKQNDRQTGRGSSY